MNPDSLRALLQALEPLRGHVIASGHIEDGTDTSVGADLLLDDGYAHADQWEADLDRGAVACPELREDNNRFRKDNAALRDALREIAKGEGRFSVDRLTHASNTVEDMKAIAVAALASLPDIKPQEEVK